MYAYASLSFFFSHFFFFFSLLKENENGLVFSFFFQSPKFLAYCCEKELNVLLILFRELGRKKRYIERDRE